MRTLVVTLLVVLVSLPAAARPRRRHHARARPVRAVHVVHVVKDERLAQEHARAEAELSDLRAGRVDSGDSSDAAQATPADVPAQTWAVQENDSEVPSNLRK